MQGKILLPVRLDIFFRALDFLVNRRLFRRNLRFREKIKDIVINRRKQELVLSLERNLLNDAINSNKLIIY